MIFVITNTTHTLPCLKGLHDGNYSLRFQPASARYGRNTSYYKTLKRDPLKGKRFLEQTELEMRQRHEHYQVRNVEG